MSHVFLMITACFFRELRIQKKNKKNSHLDNDTTMIPSQSVPFTEEPSTSRRNRIVWIALATIAVVVACVSFSFSETVRPAKTTFYKPAVKTSLEFNMICVLVCNSYIVASQARQLLNGTSRRGGSCRTPTQ